MLYKSSCYKLKNDIFYKYGQWLPGWKLRIFNHFLTSIHSMPLLTKVKNGGNDPNIVNDEKNFILRLIISTRMSQNVYITNIGVKLFEIK